jgi:hypothetical protein
MSDQLVLAPETVEALAAAIARRLAAELRSDAPEGLIDAAEVARRLGCSRSWVYDNAGRLGAIRIGSGERARLRFDPAKLDPSAAAEAEPDTAPMPAPPPARKNRRGQTTRAGAPLLKIEGGPA